MYQLSYFDESINHHVQSQYVSVNDFLLKAGLSVTTENADIVCHALAETGSYSAEAINGDIITISDKYFISAKEKADIYGY